MLFTRVVRKLVALVALALPALAHGAPTIGALVDRDHQAFCTGTLVTPNVVLTAAHCVVRDGVVTWPYAFYVGDDLRLGGVFARVVTGAVHPDYDAFLHEADFAVLRLVGDAPNVQPAQLATTVPVVDSALRAVGFGNDAVAARTLTTWVTQANARAFRYAPGTCPGDSGGPLLDVSGDVIAGVVSTGGVGCTDARAVAVAPARAWIAAAIDVVDPPACRTGDGACGTCGLGDGDCACVADDSACRLCAGSDRDCSPACGADGACATACLAPDPDCGTHEVGSACERDAECAGSICFYGTCRAKCDGATSCTPWEACTPSGAMSLCLPPTVVAGGCSTTPTPSLFLLLLFATSNRHRRRTTCNERQRLERS